MKNWLGIMIIIGAAGCQMAASPPPSETATAADLTNGDLCSGDPHYCKESLPLEKTWTTLPPSTSDTVAFIDRKSVPGYWRLYGADPVQGKVLWVRLATPQQGASVMAGIASLPAGFIDYTRPPPCSICPGGDGWLASHILNTALLKTGLGDQAMVSTSACYGP